MERSKLIRARRMLGCLLALGLGVLCTPSAAVADTASIDFLDAAGNSDPVAGLGRSWVISGSADSIKYVYVKARPSGGAPCAPSPSTDSGDSQAGTGTGDRVNGAFRITYNGTWREAGSYLFCIWLRTTSGPSSGPFSQIVNFRNPAGSISATTTPFAPLARGRGTLVISGASEAPGRVYAKMRPAGGAPCAPSYAADSGDSLVDDYTVNGAFRLNANVTRAKAGLYQACLWLFRDTEPAGAPLASQSVVFTVRSPCRVPKVTRRMKSRNAKTALRRARCGVGRVKSQYSRTRKRGRVVRFGAKEGTRMEPGTKVTIFVSKGRRPRGR